MAKPRLGQHFLADTSFLTPILDAAEITPQDAVVEVGPGKGILTKALCAQAGHVLALELDERLANHLHERLGLKKNLEVRLQDARRVNWEETAAGLRARGFAQVKLVSNLPYYLATQMVIHALAAPQGCDRLVVMVQDEVARRMCAVPGGKDFSAYSVALQYYGVPSYIVKVPPQAFNPPPKVSSAVVRIDRRPAPPVVLSDPDAFFFIVHAMFTHRRKTVRRCLQGSAGVPGQADWDRALEKAGIDFRRRPETLSIEELANIVSALQAHNRPDV
ncbi:MAG: ribosomal RNA small subunit methyltransferase A [Candidatus Firestonebacteria bacterium]|nr:ribosomal RNA small subunit methyltransferase A [Candidatus Firestonebacteria bacterium]